MSNPFHDRRDAGRALAAHLSKYANRDDVIVLALPRGGVPVGYEIAKALRAPLDVFVVRKLGVPGHEEYAMGAIGSYGAEVRNDDVIRQLHIPEAAIARVRKAELEELARRETRFRGGRPAPVLTGKTVVLVDDGLATGATMRAAIAGVRALAPKAIVVAVPVGDAEVVSRIGREADAVVCPLVPRALVAVGMWYDDFTQTEDDEVRALLAA